MESLDLGRRKEVESFMSGCAFKFSMIPHVCFSLRVVICIQGAYNKEFSVVRVTTF
jgi:hypothetical protein